MTIRVLIVEDSLTLRAHLASVLASAPDIEIAGEAKDGAEAIALCQSCRPDIITMDMMLPGMSGLAATEYIMAHCPRPILIVSSSVNRGELFKTYEALAAGAVDVLEKPRGDEPNGEWEARFITAVRLVARIRVITHPRGRIVTRKPPAPPHQCAAPGCAVVAIGASTGGPGAIVEILRALPASFRLPILLVQHINEPFAAAFADWLDGQTTRRVFYPHDGDPLASAVGRVVMAPPGHHLALRDGQLRLTHEAPRHSCRPSIDILFESIAAECGASAIGCLLTGMGKDGAAGLLRIREAGGLTIAQDEASSVIFGMPREAIALGAALCVLPLDNIGAVLAGAG
jgi:two-component system, chemotaxis family, protein-glutamate methylesterase/glutaminase